MGYHEDDLSWLVEEIKKALTEWKDVESDWSATKEYITNYFNNLDVSEEVSDKLNQMLANGQLQEIVNNYLEAQSAFISELQAYIASKELIDRNSIKTLHVGSGQTFSQPKDAIDSLQPNELAIIAIHEGGYYTTYKQEESGIGLAVPNNCYIVGIGDPMKIHLRANFDNANGHERYSTLNLTENCGLYNLRISGNNLRYVIHDDADPNFDSHSERIVKNCIIDGENLILKWAYGAGIKGGATLRLENNLIISRSGTPFSIHNMTQAKEVTNIYLKNNKLLNLSSYQNYSQIRLAIVNNYNDSTEWKPVNVFIENQNENKIVIDHEYGEGQPFKIYGNCPWEISAINGANYAPSDLYNSAMYEEVTGYNENIHAGNLVFRDSGNHVAIIDTAKTSRLFIGIALGHITPSLSSKIITRGCVELSLIGLDATEFEAGDILYIDQTDFQLKPKKNGDKNTTPFYVGTIMNTKQLYVDF